MNEIQKNLLLEEAINNLTQGVVMFDDDCRIVLRNDRYVIMYGLDPEIVKAGCTLVELIEHRKMRKSFSGDVDSYCAGIIAVISSGETTSGYITTTDGRTIHVINQPMVSGGWIVTHEDVSQQTVAEAKIAFMAHHDVLTGLPNRVLFHTQMEEALRWRGREEQLALLFIDLDNFKNINDTLGHPVGDELLKTIADRLRSCIRETDSAARLGGDEFVVIQTKITQAADVAQLAIRIREAIMAPCDLLGHQVVIDASIGIAMCPADGVVAEELVKNADMALYGAKNSGRGAYRFFEADMNTKMTERRNLELDLRTALVEGQFELHYQPLVNLARNEITACEALLRWHHPQRGLIAPTIFIPVAEETGLILRIGEWVLRKACTEAALWPDDITVAVNVSPVQFLKQNLVQIVISALATSGLPARRLEIEITEATLMANTEATLATLNQLHKLGVRIAMDDFGTGYSSLSYLQKFPFDKIKIDQSFVSGLSGSPESMAIIRAVAGLAQTLHMTTTAEGVETAEQLGMVRDLGCTEMQGYHFSKARPNHELAALFQPPSEGGFTRSSLRRSAMG